MQFRPGQDQMKLLSGHAAGQQRRWVDSEACQMVAIGSVKVRQLMAGYLIENPDNDPVEASDFGHTYLS